MDNPPRPDIPGWDWDDNDYSWLSSESGAHLNGTSIFFIHGGRVRHQSHIDNGRYSLDEFIAKLRGLAEGLDEPRVCWLDDTGGGDPGFWAEGTRLPRDDDLARLQAARDRKLRDDEMALRELKRRRPTWFPTERTGDDH